MPSQINWLSLLREIPGGSNGKTKLKELKCRRKNIQDAMTWLIKYSPGFEQQAHENDEYYYNFPVDGYIETPTITNDEIGDIIEVIIN